MSEALIVFAKPPEPGHVKTRLMSLLTAEEAATLYRAFLLDALDQYTALQGSVRLYWDDSSGPNVEVPESVTQHNQVGATLGERMRNAFEATLAAGYEHAVIIGTDHPTLPTSFIERAYDALKTPSSIVLGPSMDGGYYLLGMNAFYPGLFREMTYSHDEVFAETLERAARTDARLTVLPSWYDVDRPRDLPQLVEDLRNQPGQAPHTRTCLNALPHSFGQAATGRLAANGDG
jgi:hypothetical protein